MKLEDLGYNEILDKYVRENNLQEFEIGRITAEHRERYIVRTATAELEAEITGNMRFTAKSREDFPAVGDWVTLKTYDTNSAIIYGILPRSSVIKRQTVGRVREIQIIAANIDVALIVQAVDRDFNINRIERYLTICNASNVKPVIVLSKIDLADESCIEEIIRSIRSRIDTTPVIAISNETKTGYDKILCVIEKGKTYCLLGSSGVGKSTLLNNLCGKTIMKTDDISASTNKGRHVTSYRELLVLEHGGILIDNPGMREVGIADTNNGLERTFDQISKLSMQCRYKDCSHTGETGCAVMDAVDSGEMDRASYENYLKMMKEKEHYETSVIEKKRKEKQFGKILKNYKKDMRKNNF